MSLVLCCYLRTVLKFNVKVFQTFFTKSESDTPKLIQD